MPTFRHGKTAFLSMNVGGSTAFTNLSTFFDDSELKRMVDTAEVTAFQGSDKVFLAGLRSAEFTVSGHFDSAIANTICGQLGASTNPSFRYGPENNSTGRRRFNFGGVITGFNIKAPLEDKVSADMTVQVSGAVTSTTWTSTN